MWKFIRPLLTFIGGLTVVGGILGLLLLAFAGQWMRVNEAPVKADYIFPLAGNYNRMVKGIALHKAGYAPAILLSRPRILPEEPINAIESRMGFPDFTVEEYVKKMVEVMDAESARIEPFGNGHTSTVEEVEALKRHFADRRPSLLVVTSPYHARRVKMIMQDIMPEFEFVVTVSDDGAFKDGWWRDQDSAQHLIMEFAKTAHYLLGGAFRSTDRKE